jgi:hypothetical protein
VQSCKQENKLHTHMLPMDTRKTQSQAKHCGLPGFIISLTFYQVCPLLGRIERLVVLMQVLACLHVALKVAQILLHHAFEHRVQHFGRQTAN